MKRKVIGLTGSIATGKTSVAKLFVDEGIYVIDSDVIAKEVTKQTDVLSEVERVFGPEAIDHRGQMNRAYVGDVIFCHQDLRLKLNAIVHPHVKNKIIELIEKRKNELVVVDVPLMYETDFHELMDEIIVVYCTPEQQIERLMLRGHYDYEAAKLRVESQMSIDEKVKKADILIDNTGTKMDLYANFLLALKKIKG